MIETQTGNVQIGGRITTADLKMNTGKMNYDYWYYG